MSKKLLRIIVLQFSILAQLPAYSQIPTGTDTACLSGISYFQKTYGGNKDDYGFYLASCPDSGFVIAGRTASFGGGQSDGLLMKVSKKGTVQWSIAVGGSGNDYFQTLIRTSDNGYLAVGQTKSYGNAAGDAWLVKIDGNGVIQWAKKYGDGNADGDIGFDVVEIAEGGFIFCGTHRYAPGVADGFVVRVDNTGNITWSKQFGNGGSDQLWAITEDGSAVVVAGFYQGSSFYDGYIMKLDKATGNVIWMKGCDVENRSTQFYRIRKNGSGFQLMGLLNDGFNPANQQNVVLNLASDGSVLNARKMVIPSISTLDFGWSPRADGGFITANGDYTSSSDVIITNVNSDGTIAWSKKYARPGQQFINNIIPTTEGGYAAIGYSNKPGTPLDSNDVYLIKIDSLGTAGSCTGLSTTELTVVTPSFTNPVPNVTALGTVNVSAAVLAAPGNSFSPTVQNLCFSCVPKPTGTARPAGNGNRQHALNIFPNPVFREDLTVEIKALYNDRLTIICHDISGNKLFAFSPREVVEGVNRFTLRLPRSVKNYSNLVFVFQFNNYITSSKVFVLRN